MEPQKLDIAFGNFFPSFTCQPIKRFSIFRDSEKFVGIYTSCWVQMISRSFGVGLERENSY